jgi:hypothetical protein
MQTSIAKWQLQKVPAEDLKNKKTIPNSRPHRCTEWKEAHLAAKILVMAKM